MIRYLLPYANHRAIRYFLRLFPERVFLKLHEWPAPRFPWTDRKVTFCLSFDCDTPKDAEVMPTLLALLEQYHIPASFAVIGELVEEAPDAYHRILDAGHEVFSHGYSRHTVVDAQGRYQSTLFYTDLSPERIEEEIVRNHECLQRVLGVEPLGFRTPHFGTFQRPKQIALIHDLLRKHDYRYSSSVQTFYALQHGYPTNDEELVELPLSAFVGSPTSVFDSSSLLNLPTDDRGALLASKLKEMLGIALSAEHPVLLNIYLDPSHVVDLTAFPRMLGSIAALADKIWSGRYSDMLGMT